MKPGYRAQPNVPGVDQSDRLVPVNLRQFGPTPVQLLISTRVRKSPFWKLSIEAGCSRATVYNVALGYVPWELSGIGTGLKVELPEAYTETTGQLVDAEATGVPLHPCEHPSARERARAEGRDWAG